LTPPFRIETDAIDPLFCRSVEELDSALERLQQAYIPKGPTSVVISEADKEPACGDEIGLGLGVDPTFMLIQIAPCDGEYFISCGEKASAGSVEFRGAREVIVVDRRHFVPWRLVRGAVREFVEHGRRNKSLRWQDCFGRPAE
jgi:hypothetical protein